MARQNPKVRAITEENFYQRGELLVVSIRKFGGSAQFSDQQAEERFKEDKDVLKGVQDLLLPEDKDTLKALDTERNYVHSFIGNNSVPHELPSFYFIFKSDKAKINKFLDEREVAYKELAQNFADSWESYEKRYAEKKPKLYRANKYPKKAALLSRFVFERKWCKLQSDSLDTEIGRMKNYVLMAMKKTIIDRMEQLEKSCTDGKVSQATLDSIDTNIFEKYDRLFSGFIANTDMEKAIAEMKEYLVGTDAEMIRADDAFKDMVASKAKAIAKSISNIKPPKDDRALIF